MDKREAKRRVCDKVAKMLEMSGTVGALFDDSADIETSKDWGRILDALIDLRDEMKRRGGLLTGP